MASNQAQTRRAARLAKQAAEFRALNFHLIGQRLPNAGNDLAMGEEWDTSDGFRVRQVEVTPNRHESGHFYGKVEVIGFAGDHAIGLVFEAAQRQGVEL